MTEELTSKQIYLRSHKKGQQFAESFANFISDTTRLIQNKVSENELEDFSQELAQALGECVSWTYFTRRHRDEALGKAFEDRPKAGRNSEEQIATARAASSNQIRNHELIKEIADAIKERLRVNRQHLELKARER